MKEEEIQRRIGNWFEDTPPIQPPRGIYGTPFPSPMNNPDWILGWTDEGGYDDFLYQQDGKWFITPEFYWRFVSYFWRKKPAAPTDEEAMRQHYKSAQEAVELLQSVFPGLDNLNDIFNHDTSCIPKELTDDKATNI